MEYRLHEYTDAGNKDERFMEQKKTLWIIAASGVFLLVVIGAAMILYSPSSKKRAAATAEVMPAVQAPLAAQPQPADQAAGAAPVSPQPADGTAEDKDPSAPVNQMTITSGTTNVYGINTNNGSDANGTTTIDLNTLKAAPSPVTAQNETAAQAMAATAQETAAEPQEVPVKPVPKVQKSSEKKTATKKTPAPAAVKKNVPLTPQYWVQAASFASKKSADNARAVLDQNHISSEIFTYTDARKKLFYRVRIGPYTTQSEAEYWRSRVVLIDEFKDTQSYVTNSSAAAK